MRNSSEPLPERRLEAKSCASRATGITGSQLLQDFVERRSQDAFAELVRVYGPMVFGVCRRVVGHHYDAEDAFQSTFLVLSQKAALIKSGEILFGWLYQVAYHVSLRAKSELIKRTTKEKPMSDDCEPAAAVPGVWVELEPILDSELNRLSEKYRLPVLLCDLGGRTQKEAATELGWSQGTLSARLTKARSILAQRLARHGFTLSAGALAVLISQQAASASVPATLMATTLQTAGVLSVGQVVPVGVTSSKVLAPAQGILKSMLFVNIKLAAAAVAVLAATALGIQLQQEEPQAPADAVVAVLQPDEELFLANVVQEQDLKGQLLELLAVRDRSLMTFSAIVSFHAEVGSQYAEYLDASSDYDVFIARYAGHELERKVRNVPASGARSPTSHFRFVRLMQSQMLIDQFEGAANAEQSNVQCCNCFDGTSWNFYTPANGGHLEISATQRLTNVAAITGLELPTARMGSGQILELMQRANLENTLTVIQQADEEGFPAFVATFRIPGNRHHRSLPILVTATFTSKYGFAPIEFRAHEVYGPGNERVLSGQEFVARFTNWEQVTDGLHIAKRLTIDLIANVLLPVDTRKGFEPLLRDGKPMMNVDGLNKIDPKSYKSTSYDFGSEQYRCLSFELSPTITTPLCRDQYPAGTTVQLSETGEVYQLQTDGKPIRDSMKIPLEPVLTSSKPVSGGADLTQPGWFRSSVLFVNISLGTLLSVYLVVRFVKRRRQ